MISVSTVALLVGAFILKQFVCDFILQSPFPYLYEGKGRAKNWVIPLLIHSGIHALGTLVILLVFAPESLWWLAMADWVIHFFVDRFKASPQFGGRWNPAQSQFWVALGADQMAHEYTHLAFVVIILTALAS